MLIGERHRKIADLVNKKQSVTVEKLSKIFKVSKITIRTDLTTLESQGRLIRTHGGALKVNNDSEDLPLTVKETKHQEEKYRIAKEAVKLIQDGETIILDSGSTTLELARQIVAKSFSSLTVLTNALNVAMELAYEPKIQIVMLGGTLRKMSYSLVGPIAEETIGQFYADRLFLGVDGFDEEYGLSTHDILEARLNKKMIQYTNQIILITDSSKFGRRSLSFIARPEEINTVITDSNIPDDMTFKLRKKGVEVIIT